MGESDRTGEPRGITLDGLGPSSSWASLSLSRLSNSGAYQDGVRLGGIGLGPGLNMETTDTGPRWAFASSRACCSHELSVSV